jgi:hypothetical protein
MPHLLPIDELRRQLDAGEITREYFDTLLCKICGRRLALIVERGVPTCAVCAMRVRTARRRGW